VRLLAGLVGLLLLPGCLGETAGGGPTLDPLVGELARARWAVEKGNYQEAILLLETFEEERPGSRYMDEVLFLMGRCHMALGEYLLAVESFDRLLQDYPQSRFAEEAMYQRARSAFLGSRPAPFDQEATRDAIRWAREYLIHYPQGQFAQEAREIIRKAQERLVEKAYRNGETYRKLRRWRAARFYYEKGLGIRRDTPWAARCLEGLVRVAREEGDREREREALEAYQDWLLNEGSSVLSEDERRRKLSWVRELLAPLSPQSARAPGQEASQP
jgi:outer membrane assembly lipoprotein YfiO